jgi:hypothetical protein
MLSASESSQLTSAEIQELQRLCSIMAEGITTRPIPSYALREFAEKVRKSGLIEKGQADDPGGRLKDAESLKILLG